jgi:hypothetical protein
VIACSVSQVRMERETRGGVFRKGFKRPHSSHRGPRPRLWQTRWGVFDRALYFPPVNQARGISFGTKRFERSGSLPCCDTTELTLLSHAGRLTMRDRSEQALVSPKYRSRIELRTLREPSDPMGRRRFFPYIAGQKTRSHHPEPDHIRRGARDVSSPPNRPKTLSGSSGYPCRPF